MPSSRLVAQNCRKFMNDSESLYIVEEMPRVAARHLDVEENTLLECVGKLVHGDVIEVSPPYPLIHKDLEKKAKTTL